MLASIDSQQDIDIFLAPKEIGQLESKTLEGTIIKLRDPKVQDKLTLSINKQRSKLGIGVSLENNQFYVYIDQYYYAA